MPRTTQSLTAVNAGRILRDLILLFLLLPTGILHAQTLDRSPGSTSSPHEWIVVFSKTGRESSRQELSTSLARLRSHRRIERVGRDVGEITSAYRRQLRATTTRFLGAYGATPITYFWTIDACLVTATQESIERLATDSRVRSVWPNDARSATSDHVLAPSSSPSPIQESTDQFNHNVAAAHAILQAKGEGTILAVFDSGIDLDAGGSVPHPAFLDVSGTGTRLIDSVNVPGTIDCNWIHPYNPLHDSRDARHGTGVAGIAVGRAITINPWGVYPGTPPITSDGHAPGADLIGFSITEPPTDAGGQWIEGAPWMILADKVLLAIDSLREWIVMNQEQVHVLNFSYDGWSDPEHPTQIAFDILEREEDVLVISGASNEGDSTVFGPGLYNGLAVGAVHARTSSTGPYVPMSSTARGPLFGDEGRLFPDLCATGAGTSMLYPSGEYVPPLGTSRIRMPLIDLLDFSIVHPNNFPPTSPPGHVPTVVYEAIGTSMAAPQVSGAALLYRGYRVSNQLSDSALETRAALLLCVDDPLPDTWVSSPAWDGQHTYRNRNTYGVGYVRDDLLAAYATRSSNTDLGISLTLDGANPDAVVQYAGLTPLAKYAVVIAWPRVLKNPPSAGEFETISNFDLAVVNPINQSVLGQSNMPGNAYERLVFSVPAGLTAVELQVSGKAVFGNSVPVYVAARDVETGLSGPANVGTIAYMPQTCTILGQSQEVTRVVPNSYVQAYGSKPFLIARGTDRYAGTRLIPSGNAPSFNAVIVPSQVGGPMTIAGLALRSWRPFEGDTDTMRVRDLFLYHSSSSIPVQAHPYFPTDPGTLVAHDVDVQVKDPTWSAQGWNTWPIIIPFNENTFSYNGTAPLGIWARFYDSPPGNPVAVRIEVDTVADEMTAGYSMSRGSAFAVGGESYVFGLIEDDETQVTPSLRVYGEPSLGHTVLFQFIQASNNSPAWLLADFSSVSTTYGIGCNQYLDPATASPLAFLAVSSMGDAAWELPIPLDITLLGLDVFFQGFTGDPTLGTDRLTNGVRITIGGRF